MPRRVTSPEHKRAILRKAALKWRNVNLEKARETARAWHAAHPDYRHEWELANRERRRAYRRQQRQKNLEQTREYERKWRATNREKLRAAVRKWQQANPDKKKACELAWVKANPDKVREKNRRSEALRRAAGQLHGHHTAAEWQACLERHGHRCAHCPSTGPLTRDHIVPLSKGGSDLIENIQPLYRSCNSRKGAKLTA